MYLGPGRYTTSRLTILSARAVLGPGSDFVTVGSGAMAPAPTRRDAGVRGCGRLRAATPVTQQVGLPAPHRGPSPASPASPHCCATSTRQQRPPFGGVILSRPAGFVVIHLVMIRCGTAGKTTVRRREGGIGRAALGLILRQGCAALLRLWGWAPSVAAARGRSQRARRRARPAPPPSCAPGRVRQDRGAFRARRVAPR